MNDVSYSIIIWYLCYLLTIAAYVWPGTRHLRFSLYILLIGLGLGLNLISLFAFGVALLGIAIASLKLQTRNTVYWLRYGSLLVLSLGLAVHQVDGFQNERVFASESFGDFGFPFNLYINLDKSIAALILLFAFGEKRKWGISAQALRWIAVSTLGFFALALALGANAEFKLSQLTLVFAVLNLFTTCIAEEAFFRFVIQDHLALATQRLNKAWLPIVLTAILFMLAHFHVFEGFEQRLTLIFSAGLLYGIAYSRFNFGVAVLMHFTINIIHFVFFVYPATFN